MEFTLKLTEKILLKMLVGFKKNCNRLKIYIKITSNSQKNFRRFQKFGGNTNVNRVLFPDQKPKFPNTLNKRC